VGNHVVYDFLIGRFVMRRGIYLWYGPDPDSFLSHAISPPRHMQAVMVTSLLCSGLCALRAICGCELWGFLFTLMGVFS
jgi:hypothetical protein